MKKFIAIALMLMLVLTACASAETLQIGFENSMSEPIGQGLQKWQELLAAKDVDLTIELFPIPSWATRPTSSTRCCWASPS